MNTLKTLTYVFLVIAIAAFLVIVIDIIRTKKCKGWDVIGIILSIIIGTVCGYYIYLTPNRSIADYIKPITTAEGMNWNFRTNPQVCHEEQERGSRSYVMCPVWIEDNIQICLSYQERTDFMGYKFCNYTIRLAFPKVTKNLNQKTSFDWAGKMFVRLDNENMMESSFMTSFEENVGYYSFRVADFERMAGKGIVSIAYRSPKGLGLWKKMGDEGLTAVNEQLIYLVNYVDYVENDKVEAIESIPQADIVSTKVDQLYDKNKIAERAKVLIDYFKRYDLRKHLEDAFSNEYLNLYTHALEIPSDNPQGIGSEDWLCCFLMVEDISMFPNEPKTIQSVEIINEKTVKVKLKYFGNHEMIMVLKNGKWMLDDFDGTKVKLKKYIEEQREYFKSIKWDDYLQEWLTEGDNRYSDEGLRVRIAECRKEVEDYFKKYPQ